MFQEVDLFLCQVAPAAAGQVLLGEASEINAVELHHMIAQRFKNAAHDAVAATVDLDTGLFAVGGRYVAHCIGMDGTVVELNAVGDVLHVLLADGLVGPHLVDFLLDILRMGEFGSQVTVVGEQQHTSGVAVQTANGIDALLAGSLHQVHNGLAAIGVVTGCDAVLGLVEQDVALLLGGDDFAVVFHDVLGGDLHAELGHYLIIDHDEAFLDILVSHTARADASIGQELVQAYLHVGIDSRLLVNNALGLGCETHLGLGTLALGALLETTLLALLIATLLALLVAALLALLVAALALLIATLALLVAALALLVTALTLLVTTLTGLVTALTGLITALTGLITLTGLVAALLLFGIDGVAFGISSLFGSALGLLIALLVTLTGLITALTLLVTTLTLLVTALTLLVTTLTGLVTLALLITTLTGLITLALVTLTGLVTLLLITLGLGIAFFALMRLMGGVFYLFIATAFDVFFQSAIRFADSWSFRLFLILVHN